MMTSVEPLKGSVSMVPSKKRIIYFAHPINTYGTPLETMLLELIAKKWANDTIENPSAPKHQEAVARMRAADKSVNVMGYFLDLARKSDEVVALPFGDGKWGAGIWDEAGVVLDLKKGKYVWAIDPTTLRGEGDPVIRFVPELDQKLCLSVDETRARIRYPDGTTKPYV